MTKYDFIADLTLTAGHLALDKFQLNTFLLGVMSAPPEAVSFAWDYLAQYMTVNDWHEGYTAGALDAAADLHPAKELLIPSEVGTAPTRSVHVHVIRAPEPPKLLDWLGGSSFETLKVRKGETIHGILWVSTAQTRRVNNGMPYPMFLYHEIKIKSAKQVEGLVTRGLVGTSPGMHEHGSVNLTDAVTELRENGDKAVFIKYDEAIVLDLFHQFTHDEAVPYGQRMASTPAIIMPDFMQ